MSTAELARQSGVHRVALTKWLTGARATVTTATAERCMAALDLTVAPRTHP